MTKYVNGWRPGQTDSVECPPLSETEKRVSELEWQVDYTKRTMGILEHRIKMQKDVIKALRQKIARLKEPLLAAMEVASERKNEP